MADYNQHGDNEEKEEIYSNAVKAGKRTYFFDVKKTKGNDYYLTITESKKKYDQDGNFHYQKHKIFLYKEDFEKFGTAFYESIAKIMDLLQKGNSGENISDAFKKIRFEDLGDTNTSSTEE